MGKVQMAYNQTLDEAAYLVLTLRVRDHQEIYKVRLTENSTEIHGLFALGTE
jgi:hypothetical protein